MDAIVEFTGIKGLYGKNWIPIWLVMIMRLSGYLLMFWDPFWGIIVSFVFDCLDAVILSLFKVSFSKGYHLIDKRIDYIQYIFVLILSYNTEVFVPVSLSFLFRTIGEFVVYKTNKRRFFLFFPNFVEYIYLIYIVINKFNLNLDWYNPSIIIPLIILKVLQEFLLHVTKFGKDYWAGVIWVKNLKRH